VGQVRGIQVRSEPYGQGEQQTVWSFRVERYDPATGDRLLLVPVEIRGLSFEGSIAEGDWVCVHGRRKAGTVRATRVEDLTTSAVVEAKGVPEWLKVMLIVFVILFVVIVVAAVVFMITQVAKYG
jgi:hypothetical protein